MEQAKAGFPADLDYKVTLTRRRGPEGIYEIVETLVIAIVLVIFVVLIFLQKLARDAHPAHRRAGSLIGTFMVFPFLGFFDQHAVAVRTGARVGLVV